MSYELLMSARVEKEFRKFPPQVHDQLVAEILQLSENPYRGEQLKGRFRAFRSLHLKLKNVQYRVVYEIKEQDKRIYVQAVGTRENFYTRLKRRNLKAA